MPVTPLHDELGLFRLDASQGDDGALHGLGDQNGHTQTTINPGPQYPSQPRLLRHHSMGGNDILRGNTSRNYSPASSWGHLPHLPNQDHVPADLGIGPSSSRPHASTLSYPSEEYQRLQHSQLQYKQQQQQQQEQQLQQAVSMFSLFQDNQSQPGNDWGGDAKEVPPNDVTPLQVQSLALHDDDLARPQHVLQSRGVVNDHNDQRGNRSHANRKGKDRAPPPARSETSLLSYAQHSIGESPDIVPLDSQSGDARATTNGLRPRSGSGSLSLLEGEDFNLDSEDKRARNTMACECECEWQIQSEFELRPFMRYCRSRGPTKIFRIV
jgi:hypothetical protein